MDFRRSRYSCSACGTMGATSSELLLQDSKKVLPRIVSKIAGHVFLVNSLLFISKKRKVKNIKWYFFKKIFIFVSKISHAKYKKSRFSSPIQEGKC